MRKLIPLLFVLYPFGVMAQEAPAAVNEDTVPERSSTIFHKMTTEGWTQMTIITDFRKLISERKEDLQLPAVMHMGDDQGNVLEMEIEVELRGRNRRRICHMPPIRLLFPKKELTDHGFRKLGNKLKLVTHCLNTGNSEQTLLKEYWAYQLYNQIQPASFQAHLVQVRYVDTGYSPPRTERRLAFILESEEELADRLGGEEKDLWGLSMDQVDKETYYHTLLFQYMIGNADWELKSQRNLILVQPDSGGLPLVIPYDFDFAGLVDAPYAVPNPDYELSSVTERVAMGTFASRADLEETINHFKALKENQLDGYRESAWLDERTKKQMARYLASFFEILDKQRRLEKMFLEE